MLRLRLGLAGATGFCAIRHTHASPSSSSVSLSSGVCRPHRPTVVLVHGLDSSKQTWTGVLSALAQENYPAVALDLRGHGESPLGDWKDFSPTQLAADVHRAVTEDLKIGGKIVLVGHAMGGRVAMRYAVDYPSSLAAVIIEDMDCVPRE